jgi:uncharacterized protein YbdZ (MbtH family)
MALNHFKAIPQKQSVISEANSRKQNRNATWFDLRHAHCLDYIESNWAMTDK